MWHVCSNDLRSPFQYVAIQCILLLVSIYPVILIFFSQHQLTFVFTSTVAQEIGAGIHYSGSV